MTNPEPKVSVPIDDAPSHSRRTIVKGVTIDSAYSKDLDDAIWAVKTDQGYRVDISVSDVSESLIKDSPTDLEAKAKVETLYYRDFNKPMLPMRLSEQKLSLLPNEKRKTITVTIDLDETCEILKLDISETVLISEAKLSHKRTDDELRNDKEPLHPLISLFQEIANKLYNSRRAKGACAFYDVFSHVYADEEGNLRKYEGDFFHSQMIVQEFMILANEEIASWLALQNRPALYRNHKARISTPDRQDVLRQVNDALVHPEYLASLSARMNLWFEKAEYGTIVKGHYGLNLPAYTHFSSPIRRYADLVNHRIIKAAIHKAASPYSHEELDELAKHINHWTQEHDRIRGEKFKEQRQEIQRSKAGLSLESIMRMTSIDFNRVLKQAIKDDQFSECLEESILGKAKTANLLPFDIYYVLFRASDKWNRLKDEVLKALDLKPFLGISVLEILKQRDELIYEFIPESDGQLFYSWVKVNWKSNNTMIAAPAADATKKGAQSNAAVSWIRGYITNQLIPLELANFKLNKKPPVIENGQLDGVNYIGRLNEWAQVNKESSPSFTFEGTGPSHAPSFLCKASISLKNISIQGEGTASTKKDAKQYAAKALFLKIAG